MAACRQAYIIASQLTLCYSVMSLNMFLLNVQTQLCHGNTFLLSAAATAAATSASSVSTDNYYILFMYMCI